MTGFWSLEYRYKAGNPSSHHLDWVEGAWSINLTPFARVLVVRAKGRAVNGTTRLRLRQSDFGREQER